MIRLHFKARIKGIFEQLYGECIVYIVFDKQTPHLHKDYLRIQL